MGDKLNIAAADSENKPQLIDSMGGPCIQVPLEERGKDKLQQPGTIRTLWIIMFVILIALTAWEFLLHGPHDVSHGEEGHGAASHGDGHGHHGAAIPSMAQSFAYYCWYGLGTCILLVLFSKGLGIFLKRKDTYYDG